ncbi:MAG TPA: hypothetical protein PLC24_04330 [Myxococcota bacterium]|nr:hypothetical protein [Myxococcota bacterium]
MADSASWPDDSGQSLPEGNMAAPEGVLLWNNRVFVANANFAYQGSSLVFGTGFITVIDALTGDVLNRIPLPFPNPQEMVIQGGHLWVLCSGSTEFDPESSLVTITESGGLAGIALAGIDVAGGADIRIPVPSPKGSIMGYPSGMLLDEDTLWLASGTAAALFKADLGRAVILRGPQDPMMISSESGQNTVSIGPGPAGTMAAALFNQDTVMLIDKVDGRVLDTPWAPTQVGMDGQLDGILDIEFDDASGRIYLLLGMAGRVVSFDASGGPGTGVVEVAEALVVPNRMKMMGGLLYVACSGDNSLVVIDPSGSFPSRRVGLPVNCNPWDLDVIDSGDSAEIWVSCLKSSSVVRVRTDDVAILEIR